MSTTPNARKDAARKYQREHGVPYTAALAAVSPDADAASRRPASSGVDRAAAVIQAIRHFDEATAGVLGQATALRKLRTLLSQHVSVALGNNDPGKRTVIDVFTPEVGLWEDTIGVAFAQAYMLGTTGSIPDSETVDLSSPLRCSFTRVADIAIYPLSVTEEPALLQRIERDDPPSGELVIRVRRTRASTPASAVQLQRLRGGDLTYIAWQHICETTGGHPELTLEELLEGELFVSINGTYLDAVDLAEKAMAAALVRSSVDDPGSTSKVTTDDMKTAFEFAD